MDCKTYDSVYDIAVRARAEAERVYGGVVTNKCGEYSEILIHMLAEAGFEAMDAGGSYRLDHERWNDDDRKWEIAASHAWVEMTDYDLQQTTIVDISSDQFNQWMDEPNGKVMIIEHDEEDLKERYEG